MNQEIINSIYYLLPELTLALTIIAITVASSFAKLSKHSYYALIAGLTVTLTFILFRIYSEPSIFFNGSIANDPFASFGKLLIVFCALLITLVMYDKTESSSYIMILSTALGAICSVSSANLIMTFASLEIINISIYILLSAYKKITFKYFIYSAVSSGIMLYGISLLYGISGSVDYYQISRFLSANPFNELTLAVSIILITAGLGFKMLLFPFNFILPQISENISIRKLSLITVISLIACISVITRLMLTIFHDTNSFITGENSYRLLQTIQWQNIIAIISAASIITGSLVILWQGNLKKVFSFILISQAGYLFISLSAPSPSGTESILLNLFVFTLNSLGLAVCLYTLREKIKPLSENNFMIESLRGLGRSSPLLFISMIIFLISAAGFPFTLGFTGRLYIYSVLFNDGFAWAGIISILSSLVFFYFIFKLAYVMFSGTKAVKPVEIETIYKVILLLLTLPLITFGLYPAPLLQLCKYCSLIFGI